MRNEEGLQEKLNVYDQTSVGIGLMDFDKLFFVESEIFLTLIRFKLHIK